VVNEAASLPDVLDALPVWVDEVVLADGRPADDTVVVARRLRPGLKVVVQPGAGRGDALLAGFGACSGDIVVTIGGDGSAGGGEIVRYIGALVAGADFAKGSRFATGGGSDDMTIGRRFGNRLLSVLVNRMFRTRYTDLRCGCTAFWARHLCAIAAGCAGSGAETLMCIRAARAGLRIQEIPSHERRHPHESGGLRAVRDGWRILMVVLRERFRAASPGHVLDPGREPPGTGSAADGGQEPA
jgi:glycosyltransferase involved in cell wall biosynthesis